MTVVPAVLCVLFVRSSAAVEIAEHEGWVSPYRLMIQAQLSKSMPVVPQNACKQGLLFQAVNGRYCLPEREARPKA
jgi:hypothetical protein